MFPFFIISVTSIISHTDNMIQKFQRSIRVFHKHTKVAIIPTLYSNAICSFLSYLHHIIWVDVSWILPVRCHFEVFTGLRLKWSSLLLMAEGEPSWQYWHSPAAAEFVKYYWLDIQDVYLWYISIPPLPAPAQWFDWNMLFAEYFRLKT